MWFLEVSGEYFFIEEKITSKQVKYFYKDFILKEKWGVSQASGSFEGKESLSREDSESSGRTVEIIWLGGGPGGSVVSGTAASACFSCPQDKGASRGLGGRPRPLRGGWKGVDHCASVRQEVFR